MTINLKLQERDYYHRVLNIIHPLTPFYKLQPKEIQVLALMLYFDVQAENRGLTKQERTSLLFSYDSKMNICNILNMSDVRYRNILTSLRRKTFVTKEGLGEVTNIIRKPEDITFKISIT